MANPGIDQGQTQGKREICRMSPQLLIAPIEALTDTELTDPERRVLLSLFSFRGRNTDTVWPSVDTIGARSNLKDRTRVSKVTASLAKKGWLTKKKRGFTGCNEYKLTVPERLSNLDSETTLEPEANVASNTNSNLDSETTSNVAPETTYKEQTNEQTIEHKRLSAVSPSKGNEHEFYLQFSEYMWSKIQPLSNTKKTPNFKTWSNDIRLLVERDARDIRLVREVFDWANSHSFWKSNVLSPNKLRAQFDSLVAKKSQGVSALDAQSVANRTNALLAQIDDTEPF